jgi:hypothetical protein
MLTLLWQQSGRRLIIISRENPHDTPYIRWLVICIYIVGILFVSSSTILQYGFGLNVGPYCKTAILLCLVFYLSAKVLMYLFLAERARLMTLPLVNRKHDKIWLANMAMIVLGFGTIAVLSFVYLVAEVSPIDGQCRIGLQLGILVALGAYDFCINMWLTGLFIKLAAKYFENFFPECVSRWWKVLSQALRLQATSLPSDANDDDPPALAIDASSDLAKLARKTLVGSAIMMTSTIVNIAVLIRFHGAESGWVCLLICTIDSEATLHLPLRNALTVRNIVMVGVFMVHWVTSNPKQKA